MPVEIGEVTSTVRAVDQESLLTPRVLERIVAAVVRAIQDGESHDRRAKSERSITDGVSAERDQE